MGFNMSIYDNAQVKGFNPGRGEQRPDKYPYTGPNYQHFGEPPAGWVYSPRDDRYYRDTATQQSLQQYEEQQGLREKAPKQQGLLSALGPTAGTLGALYLTKTLAEEAVPFAKDALGLGAAGASGATSTTTALPSVSAVGSGASSAAGAAGSTGGSLALGPSSVPSVGTAGGIGSMAGSAAGLGALGAVAGGTALGGKAAFDMLQGKKPNTAGRIILGMATGGLSELAAPLFGHKSTRETAKKNTQKLMGIAPDDALYQQYVAGARQAYDSAPVDPSKPFAGKYASWEEYEKAGLEAPDLTHVFGNIETYGPDWAKLTEQQRQAITQENINRGNYYSKKGDVMIRDKKAALDAWNAAMGTAPQPTPEQAKQAGVKGPATIMGQKPDPSKMINTIRR
jgi:hypothetical protein